MNEKTGKILTRIDDSTYTAQIFNGGVVRTVLDLNPVISGGFSVNDTVIISKATAIQGNLYYLVGRINNPKPSTKTLLNVNSILGDYTTLQDTTPILAGIPSLPGDVFIAHPAATGSAFIGLFSGGAVMNYASPRAFSFLTKYGDYYLTSSDFEENTLGFVKRVMHFNISDVNEDVGVWQQVFGNIVGIKTYRDVCESMQGYIGQMTSAVTTAGNYGTWQQVGNFLTEISSDGDYANISYLKSGQIGSEDLQYNVRMNNDGLDVQWGDKTNKIKISSTELRLSLGKSSIVLSPTGIQIEAPEFNARISDKNYLKMNETSTILGSSGGIKFASSKGVEIATTSSYEATEPVRPNMAPNSKHKYGIDILSNLNVLGSDSLLHNVVHDSFITKLWQPLVAGIDLHIQASPGTPPATPLKLVVGMPLPISPNDVLSTGSL